MLTVASDDGLMERVKQGDQKAYSELFRRHGGAVLGMTLRLFSGNRALAEDITQEVWLRVLEKCEQYQLQGHFRAWLMTIARNQALMEFRKSARFQDIGDSPEENLAETFDLEEYLTKEAIQAEVKAHIDQLPESQRAPLVLWLSGDVSYENIAKELGLSLANVKTLIFRAKASLREKMERK